MKKQRVLKYTSVSLVSFSVLALSFAWGTVMFNRHIAEQQAVPVLHDDNESYAPFPIGINPRTETIVELPEVDSFYHQYVYSGGPRLSMRINWFRKAVDRVVLMPWYQSLASVSSRTLVIYAGERKEEIAHNFSKILRWSNDEKHAFLEIIETDNPSMADGKFYPGRYVVSKDATPADVAELVYNNFNREILSRYSSDIEAVIPLQDALTIASLIEREAYDFNDMRYISGVIWNRMFVDMKLQIDATLQYARASAWGGTSWPTPRPVDKGIDSPFNTYQNFGLPPHPISNPSAEAVLAALNPRKTDCLYYFHDRNAGFHCSETYEEHRALIEQYY